MPLLDLEGFCALRPIKRTLTFRRGRSTRIQCEDGSTIRLRLSGDIYETYGDGETVTLAAGELLRLRFTKGRIVSRDSPTTPPPVVQVPRADAWTHRGVAVRKGESGDWDARLHGQHAPASAAYFNGQVFLYYVGASGNRTSDGGPAFRALGVTISEDGLRPFTKHPSPVITHFRQPNHPNAEEEGVFSCAAVVEGQTLYVYYGAIEATGPGSVDVFVHVAESTDGITFTNHQRIPGITARNGEIWPFTAAFLDGIHYVWIGRRDYIDVLSGFTPSTVALQRRSGLSPRESREIGSSVVDLGKGKVAMLYDDDPMRIATAHLADIRQWASAGRYSFPEGDMGKCWLVHREAGHWLLYTSHDNHAVINIWRAPINA